MSRVTAYCVCFWWIGTLLGLPAVAAQLQVVLPDGPAFQGCTLRVYAWTTDQPLPVLLRETPVDRTRVFDLPLPLGGYGIEVAGRTTDGVVSLRQSRVTLTGRRRIELKGVRLPVRARVDGADAPVVLAAVRRLGDGDDRWTDTPAADPAQATAPASQPAGPVLVLSPGERYAISCVAQTDRVLLALWRAETPKADGPLGFADAEADYDVAVDPASGTPPLADVAVTVRFPDTVLQWADARHRRLRTNRDRAVVGYRLTTQAGERIAFSETPQRFSGNTRIPVGGRLTPCMAVETVTRHDDAADRWTDYLVRRVYLCDRTGRWADLAKSSFGFACAMTYAGRTFDDRAADDLIVSDRHTYRPDDLAAAVSYQYGGRPVRASVRGSGPVAVGSRRYHFGLGVPAPLRARAAAFLQMLEIVHDIDVRHSGRPGPAQSTVDLWLNDNGAQATIGDPGGANGGAIVIEIPFVSLENFADPFYEPDFCGNGDPFLCHEVLHTCGYQHGDEMTRLELMGEETYRQLRWRAVDTGVWPVWAE